MTTLEPENATILIVEDNPDNMFVLKSLLESRVKVGFCDGRASGAQLFGMLASKPKLKPDLILLDIQIPNEDGYTILAQIRNRPLLRNTKVVAVTANVMEQDVQRCRKAGFDGFIGKPIKPRQFPDQIRRILAGEEVWEPI
jgi:two-component system, cell cycle response regulator DivK